MCVFCQPYLTRSGTTAPTATWAPVPVPFVPTPYAANLPVFLYPFLAIESKARPLEYLRLTSLGVIGALVKVSERAAWEPAAWGAAAR
mgnify:CR=1 FL=1